MLLPLRVTLFLLLGLFQFSLQAQSGFQADTLEGRPPLTVSFSPDMPDTLGQIVSYYWDFGNGQISTEARPTVTYRNPRKYNVALTVRDAAGKEANFVREGLIKIPPLFTHDAIVFGFLFVILALVFITANSKRPFFQKFYRFVPAILLCYFIPALLNWPFGLISGEFTNAYNPVTSRYLLPASLILLCVSIDFKGIINLGPKALIMFFTATLGIVIGGPIALLLVGSIAPGVVESAGANELWEGLSTIAGSWIGGGANQAAMKEIFEVNERLFSAMVVVDVVVANIWMGFLLYGASISKKVDGWFKADSSAIDDLKNRVENYRASIERNPTTTDYYKILAVAFGGTALAHFGADLIVPLLKPFEQTLLDAGLSTLTNRFFWLIVIATTLGVGLSFTRARKLEGVGASKIGTVFIYILVASIGMKMNLGEVFENLGAFAIGLVWMLIHVTLLLSVGKLIRAPFFFTAVGSQANVGGAASAPVVAAAFSPALAPVGVLMAVMGYALGTYGAWFCAILMQWVS